MAERIIVLVMALGLCASGAWAGISSSGSVSPPNPDSWTTSTTATVGDAAPGSVTVDFGSDIFSRLAYLGYQAGGDGHVTLTGSGSTWTNSSTLQVGRSGQGVLDILSGAGVSNNQSHIGFYNGAGGEVNVSGLGSSWSNSGIIHVGNKGGGDLNINDGGAVSGAGAKIGSDSGSNGVVTITDAGSTWTLAGAIDVGFEGSGLLGVSDGAVVSSTNGKVGYQFGSTGVATVSGTDSTWTNSEYLHIGQFGNGTLNLAAGGLVEVNRDAYLATEVGSTGALNFNGGTLTTGGFLGAVADMSGTGTINTGGLVSDVSLVFDATHGLTHSTSIIGAGLNVTVNFDVDGGGSMGAGYSGTGSLSISDGLDVMSINGHIAYGPGSDGTVTVSGTGSAWTNSRDLFVGRYGDGALSISGGAVVTNRQAFVGDRPGSVGEVTVNGAGSIWRTMSAIGFEIGGEGRGSLSITNGGTVIGRGFIGVETDSVGEVIVSGEGSSWSTGGQVFIGDAGSGSLEITDGADVSCGRVDVGYSVSGQVIVNGSGSTWTTLLLNIGQWGDATMDISNGGAVSSSRGIVGNRDGSNAVVRVDGIGSAWIVSEDLRVGYLGSGALNLTQGAFTYVAGVTSVTWTEDSSGSIHFGSGGGAFTTSGLRAAPGDLTGVGTINTGGLVSDLNLLFDAANGLTQTLHLADAGNHVTVNLNVDGSSPMGAGYWGSGSMQISAGRDVQSTDGFIGDRPGSLGAVTVSGEGTTWVNSKDLYVGYEGRGTLGITGGADVSSVKGYIAYGADSSGEVTVSGSGSTWANSGHLMVGEAGDGVLNIASSAVVTDTEGRIAQDGGSTGAVTVNGVNSAWTNSGRLIVGGYGDGAMSITAGASVTCTNGDIGDQSGSGTATVSGGGSPWTNSGRLYVGGRGDGSLMISDGGFVGNTDGRLADFVSSTGSVLVTGAGSTWANSGDLLVGRYGPGILTVEDGGLVSVGGTLTTDFNGGADSFVNMGPGGALALKGSAADSLASFLILVRGSDAIRYWDGGNWVDIAAATLGVDYTLTYRPLAAGGDLADYTLLRMSIQQTVRGDTNDDDVVDELDFANLVAQLGGPPAAESADFTGDNIVDLRDFAIMRGNYGFGVPAASDPDFVATTPEPGTLTLLGLGAVAVLRRRRRR